MHIENVKRFDLMRDFRTTIAVAGLLFAASSFTPLSVSSAQPQKIAESAIGTRKTVRVIPGEYYRAGALHRLLFGDHWRSLWTSPMDAQVLDLEGFAGGLKPFETGGGFQTISLRFMGADGKEYRFRTIDKDPSRGMPKKLRNTVVSDVVQDQVSSSNPSGALIISPMLDAAGILHAPSKVVVMPYDRKGLGKYYEEFAGLLGTIEEHPDENDGAENAFAGADSVVKTYTMLSNLEKDNRDRIDAKAYLKARLIDVLIGDWDRHTDQWRWAGYNEGATRVWKPVPKDRDNAFSRQDGLFSWVITQIIPRIEGFNDDLDEVYFLSWSGRSLDRRIFPRLTRPEWDAATKELQLALTDDQIETAVRRMPEAMYAKEGVKITHDLRSRRDLLGKASDELYRIYAEEVDIYASDQPEFAEVERRRDGSVAVRVFSMDEGPASRGGEPIYSRVFDPEETSEIRLYLLGGNDYCDISGIRAKNIDVRVIGGKGEDRIMDRVVASSGGFSAKAKNYLYDSDATTTFGQGNYSLIDTTVVEEPADERTKYDMMPRDYGREFDASIANLQLDYAPEYGAFLGWGVILEDYGFRKEPYNYTMKLGGGLASGSDSKIRYKLTYNGDFRSFIDGTELHIDAGTTGLEVINFYGFGNDSSFDTALYDENDFEIKQQLSWLRSTLIFPANSDFQFRAGLRATVVDLDVEPGSRLEAMNPNGIDEDFTAGFTAGFRYDNRECGRKVSVSPRQQLGRLVSGSTSCGTTALSGTVLDVEGSYYPEFLGNSSAFGKVKAEGTVYLPFFSLPNSRLAMRVGGEKIWGDFPFYEAAYLGGSKSLRGYDKQRFAGDASLYANSELRLYLGSFKFLVPVLFGPLAFIDTGRVYYDGDASGGWHTGYGGGLWFGFIENRYALSVAYGRGVDSARLTNDAGIYVRTGFSF
ncbi:MAG: outer membrane protein assembly factor [Ignavibacteriaceae bacterium]|nr:outer membrane protein assembly factor [Ignavibacteriaceae bacterium]